MRGIATHIHVRLIVGVLSVVSVVGGHTAALQANDLQARYEQQFGARHRQAASSETLEDDALLAADLLAQAKQSEHDVAWSAMLLDDAYQLGVNDFAGSLTAMEAVKQLIRLAPQHRNEDEKRLIRALQQRYRLAPDPQSAVIGAEAAESLVWLGDHAMTVHRLDAAGAFYNAARDIAKRERLLEDFRAIEHRRQMHRELSVNLRKLRDLREAYKRHPDDRELAQQLIWMYLLDVDQPEAALKLAGHAQEMSLRQALADLRTPFEKRESAALLRLAQWYEQSANRGSSFGRRRALVHAAEHYQRYLEQATLTDDDRAQAERALSLLQQQLAPRASDTNAGLVGRELIVDAKRHAASTPLRSGLKLTAGQQVVFKPNPADQWFAGHGPWVGYRGRTGRPSMKLRYRLAGQSGDVTPQTSVAASHDGELLLYCDDDDDHSDNEGFIRVRVVVTDR